MTILVVVLVPFAWAFANSLRTSGQSQHMTVAYNAAQRQIQRLRAIPYGNLDNLPTNSYNGGTNFFASPITVNGQTVYRTTIPSVLLPDPRTELPGASGTIDLRQQTLTNATGNPVNYAAATVTITWTDPGHRPFSITLKTLLSDGGINDV